MGQTKEANSGQTIKKKRLTCLRRSTRTRVRASFTWICSMESSLGPRWISFKNTGCQLQEQKHTTRGRDREGAGGTRRGVKAG